MISENLPAFFEKYVGKTSQNFKNVQHRQISAHVERYCHDLCGWCDCFAASIARVQ
jgi:hypothetical protein